MINPFITRRKMLKKWDEWLLTHEVRSLCVYEFAKENHISHMRAASDPLIQFDVRRLVHEMLLERMREART